MNLKSITFGFENCEVITIEGKYICRFFIDDFYTYFARTACNSIEKVDVAQTFSIEIAALADGPHNPFGCIELGFTKFKRFLAYNDITSIEFILCDEDGDEKTYSYWMPWNSNSEEVNKDQFTYLSELGNLYIVVSKDKKFEDFFDKEKINNKTFIKDRFDMCDIPYNKGDF